jgi:hypothetical protein
MKFFLAITVASLLAIASASPGFAQGQKTGFDEEETTTQGGSGKVNTNANPDNQGQTTVTTTGPKGQLAKDNTDCNNCDTETTDLPGQGRDPILEE